MGWDEQLDAGAGCRAGEGVGHEAGCRAGSGAG